MGRFVMNVDIFAKELLINHLPSLDHCIMTSSRDQKIIANTEINVKLQEFKGLEVYITIACLVRLHSSVS